MIQRAPIIVAGILIVGLMVWWAVLLFVLDVGALAVVGGALVVAAALAAVALVRAHVLDLIPRARDLHLDMVLLALVLAGHVISSVGQVRDAQSLEALRDYSYVARLTIDGTSGRAGAGLTETTAISKMLADTRITRDKKVFPNCDEQSLKKYRATVDEHPRFPFSHWSLSVCLRIRRDPAWKHHAHEAVNIFRKTTRLADHHPSHDEALRGLENHLAEPD